MARIRTIKPNFFKNEDLSRLAAETQLLAAGLLCYADDEGYFNANPKLVQAEIFPLRDLSVTIHGMLTDLSNIGYIRLGKCANGRIYGHVVNFLDHQVINRPKPSEISCLEISWTDHGLFSDSSVLEGNKEGNKEKERNKTSPEKPKPSDPRHKPIADYIKQCITYATKLDPAPWSGRDAKALSVVLQNNPSWDVEVFKRLIQNRFRSDGIPRGDPAHKWLTDLSKYADGPLNQFGKAQVNSNGNKASRADQLLADLRARQSAEEADGGVQGSILGQ